jgi:hypothetical protein
MENKAMQRFVAVCSFFKSLTFNRKLKIRLYKLLIWPILLYGALTWDSAAQAMMKLQVIQNKIIRSIYDGIRYVSSTSIHIGQDVRILMKELKEHSQSFINPSGKMTTQS